MKNKCRLCGSDHCETVVDLGLSPVSNHLIDSETAQRQAQTNYPLHMVVCTACWLVQLAQIDPVDHFHADYAYFSSYSSSWLQHAERYSKKVIALLALDEHSLVVELASNDGYLLQYFKKAGVATLGIEPSANVAEHARTTHGIETIVTFFGKECARQLAAQNRRADLIVANNVLAHVPDIDDFVAGVPTLLKADGAVTFEFPHLLQLLRHCQFDTIYHEHFSYLSLGVVEQVLTRHGLVVTGLEELPTHGGSLRVYAGHTGRSFADEALQRTLEKVRQDEQDAGLQTRDAYTSFQDEVIRRKTDLLSFLIKARRNKKSVLGYGAPAKASTLLNYCGVGPELLAYTVDLSMRKQGSCIPGVNIPIHAPERLLAERPDYVLILPWNLREEIAQSMRQVRDWGGRFVTAIPEIEVF